MARRFRAEVRSCASELRVDLDDVDQLVVDEFLDAETKEFVPVARMPDAAEEQVERHVSRTSVRRGGWAVLAPVLLSGKQIQEAP